MRKNACVLSHPLPSLTHHEQKSAVAVAYARAGKGLVKLNGEQASKEETWARSRSSTAVVACPLHVEGDSSSDQSS